MTRDETRERFQRSIELLRAIANAQDEYDRRQAELVATLDADEQEPPLEPGESPRDFEEESDDRR